MTTNGRVVASEQVLNKRGTERPCSRVRERGKQGLGEQTGPKENDTKTLQTNRAIANSKPDARQSNVLP